MLHLPMVTMRVGGPLVVWKHVITIKIEVIPGASSFILIYLNRNGCLRWVLLNYYLININYLSFNILSVANSVLPCWFTQ